MGHEEKTEQKVVREQDFLFEKSWTCPVCHQDFKALTVRSSKVRVIGKDPDLRPRYDQLDMLKYDVVMCPSCGYAALAKFFPAMTPVQAKNIKEMISARFTPQTEKKEIYTYDEAVQRYRVVLANALAKMAKAGEKAYISLKLAWILRSKMEHLEQEAPGYEAQKKQCESQEEEFARKALDGFIDARQTEDFPICGMDQPTLDYLIAVLALRFGQYDVSSHMISGILQSDMASPRVKDKARDLKEEVLAKKKEAESAAG